MKTIRTAIMLSTVVLTGVAGSARHIELVSSHPAADTVLTSPPTELLLTFSADLDFPRSAVTMRSTDGASIQLGDPQTTNDPRQMKLAIMDEMDAGTYTVSWVAAPKDDHGGRGRYGFEVR